MNFILNDKFMIVNLEAVHYWSLLVSIWWPLWRHAVSPRTLTAASKDDPWHMRFHGVVRIGRQTSWNNVTDRGMRVNRMLSAFTIEWPETETIRSTSCSIWTLLYECTSCKWCLSRFLFPELTNLTLHIMFIGILRATTPTNCWNPRQPSLDQYW